jgi:YfiR/HmsC-like
MERSLGASDGSVESAFFHAVSIPLFRVPKIMIRLHRSLALFAVSALLSLLISPMTASSAMAAQTGAQEYQVKAVFLFNFTQFVGWPSASEDAQTPIVIGILGDDPFGSYLDDTVRGEKVGDRPLIVRRYRHLEDVDDCQILFISRSEAIHFEQIAARLKDRSILTVSDADQSGKRGGIVRFVTEKDRVKLHISVNSAKDAGLTISSKLLRVAEIDDGAGR